jgi:hypothetical protein
MLLVPSVYCQKTTDNLKEQDTLVIEMVEKGPEKIDTASAKYFEDHSPQKAVIYSAILPGLGQVYNKKYWKVPIIYGGFYFLAYALDLYHKNYMDYKKGYAHFIDSDSTTLFYQQLDGIYLETTESNIKEQLSYYKDAYRRERDMTIIWMAGLYFLNIIDALVDAHFYDYDIGKDLSLRVQPKLMNNRACKNAFGLHCRINF